MTEPIHQTSLAPIPYYRYLRANGELERPLPSSCRHSKTLLSLYRNMVLTRAFDAKAVALQRTGRLGTFASSLGQEATAVGIGAAMRTEDVLLPSFREQGAQLVRGVRMAELFSFWGGDERGSDFAGPREDFPVCIPVGSQAPHAVGVALAFKLRNQPRVAVCVFGDGATSKGDVYEALNFAGVQKLPVVFVINNNQWAISVPRERQSATPTLAQKAVAAGMPGEQVDGNDVIAVTHHVEQALEKARRGDGPTLIEALTYRLSDHTTVDDASRYRSDEEVSARWGEEPLARMKSHLLASGQLGKEEEENLLAECDAAVDIAIAEYQNLEPQPLSSMFDFLYRELPGDLGRQQQMFAAANGSDESVPSGG